MGTTNLDRLVIDELVVAGVDVTAAIAEMATLDGLTATATELNYNDITTIGTVQASKACVVDANKDLSAFRNLGCVNLDAGSSGSAGSVDIFPGTALMGKLSIVAAAAAGNTTTTITNASQAAARIYTVPDAGADASFVMTAGAQTVAGAKTFTSLVTVGLAGTTAGQIDLKAPTAANGSLGILAADLGADFRVSITTSGTITAARTCTLPVEDAAFQLLTTGATDQTLAEGKDIALGTVTGTKIGTGATQKLAFWNATPVVQQAFIAAPTGGATVDAEARAAVNSLRTLAVTLGMTAAA